MSFRTIVHEAPFKLRSGEVVIICGNSGDGGGGGGSGGRYHS